MGGDPTFINAAVAPIPAVPGIAMEPRGSTFRSRSRPRRRVAEEAGKRTFARAPFRLEIIARGGHNTVVGMMD